MSRKIFKAGILIVILVIPALVFIFLKTFGENKFNLPYFFPEQNYDGSVQIIEGDTVFHKIDSLKLKNFDGSVYNLSSQKEKLKIVSFFFSRCGTICPITNKNIQRISDVFKNDNRVSFLSITVDPEFDNEKTLAAYATQFNPKNKNWFFLTGDKNYIYQNAINNFKLPVSDAKEYDSSVKNLDEQFIHSDKILLLDEKNYIRGIYSSTENLEIDRLKLEIKVLLDGINKRENK